MRFINARSSWWGRPDTLVEGSVARRTMSRPVRRTARSTTVPHSGSRSTASTDSALARWSVASSTSSASIVASSLVSKRRSSSIAARSDAGSRPAGCCSARARSSTLVRRLVSGVRISWLASEMSCCCCALDRASESTIVDRLEPSTPISSVPVAGIVVERSPVSAMWRALRVSSVMGRTMRVANRNPTPAAARIVTAAISSSRTPSRLSTRADSTVLRASRSDPAPGRTTVSTRAGSPSIRVRRIE